MTIKRSVLAFLLLTVWVAAGCGDDDGAACDNDGVCDSGETTQNCPADCPVCVEDGTCDAAGGETPTNCPADCATVQCDLTLSGTDYDYLVSSVFLPDDAESAQEIGMDLDGDGLVDNRLGNIISMLAATSPDFDVNEDVNGGIENGDILMVLRLRTDGFPDDPDVLIQLLKGQIHDATPLYDGSDNIEIHSNSATDEYVCGLLSGGELDAGPNAVRMPFPLPGMGTLMYNLQATQLLGPVTDSTWTQVMLGGGVPADEIQSVLFPALLVWMNEVISADPTSSLAEGMIELLDGRCNPAEEGCESVVQGEGECDDTQNPPVITETELRCNTMMRGALEPDVDLDGNGTPDAISVGLRIDSAVPVTVVP